MERGGVEGEGMRIGRRKGRARWKGRDRGREGTGGGGSYIASLSWGVLFGSLYCSPILRTPSNKLVSATTTNWGTARREEREQEWIGWTEKERRRVEKDMDEYTLMCIITNEVSDVEKGKVMRWTWWWVNRMRRHGGGEKGLCRNTGEEQRRTSEKERQGKFVDLLLKEKNRKGRRGGAGRKRKK